MSNLGLVLLAVMFSRYYLQVTLTLLIYFVLEVKPKFQKK